RVHFPLLAGRSVLFCVDQLCAGPGLYPAFAGRSQGPAAETDLPPVYQKWQFPATGQSSSALLPAGRTSAASGNAMGTAAGQTARVSYTRRAYVTTKSKRSDPAVGNRYQNADSAARTKCR